MKIEVLTAIPAFTQQFEDKLGFMYTDIVGLVTTGFGDLIDWGKRRWTTGDPLGLTDPSPALALGWRHSRAKFALPTDELATAQEIRSGWWAVKNAWPRVQSGACEHLTDLRLTESDVDTFLMRVVTGMWAHAQTAYFADCEEWVAPAQLGLVSLMWAMGDEFEAGYPKFVAAARVQDWMTCARECLMVKPPVPEARNTANVKLFKGAAAGLTIAEALAARE